MNRTRAIAHNRSAWDRRADEQTRFTRPLSDKDLKDPHRAMDPWVAAEGVEGKRLLCLGAGGGRQGVLYAAAGAASVTVVDLSDRQLATDRRIASERGLPIRTLATSMDELGDLEDQSFDMVVHPVSTCYLPRLERLYGEVARVIRDDGLYVSQHKQPASLQAHIRPAARGYEILLPYQQTEPLPEVTGSLHREPGTLEFIHTLEQLIGLMCRAGFCIEDLSEPDHGDPTAQAGTFKHRSLYLPPYLRLKARRHGGRRTIESLLRGVHGSPPGTHRV